MATVDRRGATFGFGVPLRPRLGATTAAARGLVHQREHRRVEVPSGAVPWTDDPTVPRWEALPPPEDAGVAATGEGRRGCGCGGGCGCGVRRWTVTVHVGEVSSQVAVEAGSAPAASTAGAGKPANPWAERERHRRMTEEVERDGAGWTRSGPVAERPLYAAAAPVLKVDGQRDADLARDLLRLEVHESTDGLRQLTLHLVASAARDRPSTDVVEYLNGTPLDFGKPIEVSLGPPGTERLVFKGTISALEASFDEGDVPHVTVRAEDELMKLRMTVRSATYRQVSDADIARTIAGKHGLTPEVAADGPTYDLVQQVNQSDLAFLHDRARMVAAEVWALDGHLHFTSRPERRGTELTLTQGSDQLLSVSVAADLAHQCSEVAVSGFDASQREQIEEKAAGSIVDAEISGGTTGPEVLGRAMGELPGRRVRTVPLLAAEARAYARAEMLRRSRGFVQVRGTTAGSPEMVVGSRVTLERCGKPFDGPGYYVTRVHHVHDLAAGARTHFCAERPTVNQG